MPFTPPSLDSEEKTFTPPPVESEGRSGFDLNEFNRLADPATLREQMIQLGLEPRSSANPSLGESLISEAGQTAADVNSGLGELGKSALNVAHLPVYLWDKLRGAPASLTPFSADQPILPQATEPILPQGFLPQLSPQANEFLSGAANRGYDIARDASTPSNIGLGALTGGIGLADEGMGMAANKLIGSYFTGQIGSELPEAAANAGTTFGDINSTPEQKGAALAGVAVPAALGGAIYHGLREPGIATGTEPNRVSPDIEREAAIGGVPIKVGQSPGVSINPLDLPWTRNLADQALKEAQGGTIRTPTQEPALLALRRQLEPETVAPQPTMTKAEPLSGQNPEFTGLVNRFGQRVVEPETAFGDRPLSPEEIAASIPNPSSVIGSEGPTRGANVLSPKQWERLAIEQQMHIPQEPMEPLTPEQAQFPAGGGPAGTLSNLQRERMLAGKRGVRAIEANNPPAPAPFFGRRDYPFFDRQSEALGLDRPSLAPTVEDVRATRAAEERAQNAPNVRQQPEGGVPERAGTTQRENVRQNGPEVRGQEGTGPERSNSPEQSRVGQAKEIADNFGIRYEGEQLGRWMFTAYDESGKPSTTFVTKAGAAPHEVAAKYETIRKSYEGAPNGPRELLKPKEAGTPQPDWKVAVQAAIGEAPASVQIIDPSQIESGTSPTVESLRAKGHYVPDFSKLPQGSYTYGEALAKAVEIESHGGAESTLTHEQRAISRKNNSREAFEKLQAEADAAKANLPEQSRPSSSTPHENGPPIETAPVSEPTVESVTALEPTSGAELSATDSLINRLEALRLPETGQGRLYSLPHPDAIAAIGKSVWNTAIDTAIAAVKAGRKIGEAINEAISYVKKNASGFSEDQIRANLDHVISAETAQKATSSEGGGEIRSADKSKVGADVEIPRGENIRMRNLSARGTQAESVPASVQKTLAQSPESFYRQQGLTGVSDAVRAMSDADLAGVGPDSDIFTAAKLEQANRLFDAGKKDAGYRVFQDLSKTLTRLGQVVNQAKLLNALRPEHVIDVVNEGLKKAGKDPLTPKQMEKLEGASRSRIEGQRGLDKATDAWVNDPTDANAAKAEKALRDANEAALAEQRIVHNFQDRSMAALFKAILQGNLLTPISQVANFFGNISFVPFRIATRAGAASMDILDSFIRNRPRQVSVGGTGETVAGLIKGVKEIPGILRYGSGDVIKGESRASMHPLRAWAKQFAADPEMPTTGGKLTASDRIKLAIEGTLGVPAEVMLRGLGAGDIAFREAARARLIAEQSRINKVPEGQRKMAQNFPELFFDKSTLAQIEAETRGAIFQRESKTLGHIMSWLKSRGNTFDFLVSTVAPYKLTPWNIVGEIMSYNPLVAVGRTALEAKRGNIRAAETNAAKIVVGTSLIYAGQWLYNKGLLAPSMDGADEVQKARVLAGQVLPPNHINISGLKRAMSGGDPSFQPGDKTYDVFRAGGLAGSMLYMTANVGRDLETKPGADNMALSLLKNSTIEQARFGLNQSFLKGVTGLLDAVREGDADTYLQSYAGTVLSIPLPNTLSAISRAERQYKVETKGENLGDQLSNVVKTRLGFLGLDDYLPLKRGLWGEPIQETPKDRNALIYHFFDITKGQQVTDDPVALELYRLWRKTANTSIIPSPPEKTFTFAKQTYLLDQDQRSRLAELVGHTRREIVDKLVINPNFHKLPDEAKIKMLGRVYEKGLDVGKVKFWMESQNDLEKKPARAGFAAE